MATSRPAGEITISRRTKGNLTVIALCDMIHVDWHPAPISDRYRVITNTGFLATFQACRRDGCLNGSLTPCRCGGQGSQSVHVWLNHCRNTCHEWHDVTIVAFAEKVLGSVDPSRVRPVGARAGYYRPKDFVGCPSWPVERQGRLVTFMDGRPRPVDYGYDVNTPIVASGTESTS